MEFCDVWDLNLKGLMREMVRVGRNSRYVAVETQNTGMMVRKPMMNLHEVDYDCMRLNLQEGRLLQLGLTFIPYNIIHKPIVFQINFAGFDHRRHYCHPRTLKALIERGYSVETLNYYGVDGPKFWKKLMKSGLIMNSGLRWVCLGGAYDFAYMLKGLYYKQSPLPDTKAEFCYMIRLFFPHVFDVRHLVRFVNISLPLGLKSLALTFNVHTGIVDYGLKYLGHQAGSDSLRIMKIFMKLLNLRIRGSPFPGFIPHDLTYWGVLYGFGSIFEYTTTFTYTKKPIYV